MKKIYFLLSCAMLLYTANTSAQCVMTGRYETYLFPTVDVSTVSYSSVVSADTMDIYEPHGDVYTMRPLIIMAHGGSFIGGTRRMNDANTDPACDTFCLRYARRGYVVANIDYRLTNALNMLSAAPAADAVAKAISDGKAAIRYLVQHRTTYNIDTNNIFIGGNSAGAVLFMHVGYLDSVQECNALMNTALSANGGFDGNSGNPGYTTKARGIINLAGALNTVGLVGIGDLPSVNCQGDLDATVPYTCDKPLSHSCPDTLCGLGSLAPQYTAMGINHWDHVFVGQQHVPWDGDAAMMNTVDSLTREFLYSLVCSPVTSVNQINTSAEVNLFPNPASDMVNINATMDKISSVTVYDQMGRQVSATEGINSLTYQLNTSYLSKGMYLVKVGFADKNTSPVVRRVAVQ